MCGGSDSCTVTLRAGEEHACVYVKMDGDDILEDDRTETLTLTSGDDAIIIGDPGQLEISVIDDDCEFILVWAGCIPNISNKYVLMVYTMLYNYVSLVPHYYIIMYICAVKYCSELVQCCST